MSVSVKPLRRAPPVVDPDPLRVDGRRINAGCGDLTIVTAEAIEALVAHNDPPELFSFAGRPARLEHCDGHATLAPVGVDIIRHHLARSASWYKRTEKHGEQPAVPPDVVCRDLLATSTLPLPPLTRIVSAPVFAPDGTLSTTPGYQPASRTYYQPAPGFVVPHVASQPSDAAIAEARRLYLEELLCDFPFTGEAEIAHAVALIVLPYVRELIPGPTPLFLIEKPSPGTGAGLLSEVVMYPMLGGPVSTLTEAGTEEEWRKRITAKLLTAPTCILIDNVRARLDSAALSAALTTPLWEDRRLGASDMVKALVRCAWLATGNNPALSTEMSRRTIRIRLDARRDRPWLRTGFRHDDLRAWARDHRDRLVWAALTLGRAWIAADQPPGIETLGMFEEWARVTGGILAVAGIPGFLGNLEALYERSDTDGASWRQLVAAWWDAFGDTPVGVGKLWALVNPAEGEPIALPLGSGTERSQRTRFGLLLQQQQDRHYVVGDPALPREFRIAHAGEERRATLWRLREVSR